MRSKPILTGMMKILIVSLILVGVQNTDDTNGIHQNLKVSDVEEAIVPPAAAERLAHPDVIYTPDGKYVKTQMPVPAFNDNEVVYDDTKTTAETRGIFANDAVYIKSADNH